MGKVEANSQQRVQKEWLDLRALTDYVAVSERTVREWIHRAENPPPRGAGGQEDPGEAHRAGQLANDA